MMRVPESSRLTDGPMRTTAHDGNNGVFVVPSASQAGWNLYAIASDGDGWEHVSVQAIAVDGKPRSRVPTWREMCQIKETFWADEACCYQLHPPKSEYVNCHPSVLHIWRNPTQPVPRPPAEFV